MCFGLLYLCFSYKFISSVYRLQVMLSSGLSKYDRLLSVVALNVAPFTYLTGTRNYCHARWSTRPTNTGYYITLQFVNNCYYPARLFNSIVGKTFQLTLYAHLIYPFCRKLQISPSQKKKNSYLIALSVIRFPTHPLGIFVLLNEASGTSFL